jgi:hypothetical protein
MMEKSLKLDQHEERDFRSAQTVWKRGRKIKFFDSSSMLATSDSQILVICPTPM